MQSRVLSDPFVKFLAYCPHCENRVVADTMLTGTNFISLEIPMEKSLLQTLLKGFNSNAYGRVE